MRMSWNLRTAVTIYFDSKFVSEDSFAPIARSSCPRHAITPVELRRSGCMRADRAQHTIARHARIIQAIPSKNTMRLSPSPPIHFPSAPYGARNVKRKIVFSIVVECMVQSTCACVCLPPASASRAGEGKSFVFSRLRKPIHPPLDRLLRGVPLPLHLCGRVLSRHER